MITRLTFWVLIGLGHVALFCAAASAQEEAADYQKVFDKVAQHNAQIKTGVFHAHGELKGNPASPYPPIAKLEFFCAFDFHANKLRFDRRLESGETLKIAEYGGGQYVRTPGQTITFPSYLSDIRLDLASRKPPSWIKIIDIRALGLCGEGDIMQSASFDDVLINYRKMERHSIRELGDGLLQLEWIHGRSVRVATLDKNKSYAVVRHTLMEGKKVEEDHRITVEKRNDTWVPVGWHSVDSTGEHSAKIDWKSLNEEVDSKHFTWEDFEIKRAHRVIDSSLPQPVVVKEFATETK
ncbi:hypothetical protein [Anatilimnocola floriformis]|uniref:hypothetical protein n=1 Tax=Anatilimnocola floriformis TaxID=2948575 RepID=UPI0020C5282D|nr:hypothetical protein [Anatilimnocola floriformis]